jgi:ubiquinone biosynthesis protein UbiJ
MLNDYKRIKGRKKEYKRITIGRDVFIVDKYLNRLFYKLEERSHLLELLPSKPFTALIQSDSEAWMISLSEQDIYYQSEENATRVDLEISGSEPILKVLLNGEVRLSQLKKMGHVQVEGSFRHLLLLEAVLWLCRKYEGIAESDPLNLLESF